MWRGRPRPRFFLRLSSTLYFSPCLQRRFLAVSALKMSPSHASDQGDPTMSTVLITGASGGIGYELAKLFARDHHNLVLVARSTDKLAQVATELQTHGVRVKTIALDLAALPAS